MHRVTFLLQQGLPRQAMGVIRAEKISPAALNWASADVMDAFVESGPRVWGESAS